MFRRMHQCIIGGNSPYQAIVTKPAQEWQVAGLLKTTAEFFLSKGVDEARLGAELLLAHVLKMARLDLYLQHERPVYPDELERFRELCRQRLGGRPLQYITGEQWFYGLPFHVDRRVLIPRPETELLVEFALELLEADGASASGGARILDAGTGSGCIALTMALRMPTLQAVGIDVSLDALEVARTNAERHGAGDRVSFAVGDMTDPLFSPPGAPFDMLVSNPPYIPESEWAGLQPEVRDHEPKLALTVPVGMECYQVLSATAGRLLRPGGWIAVEIHADGARGVVKLFEEAGMQDIVVKKDYAGLDRIVGGRLPR
jgi:release factor glutamine methyltransferase